MTDAELRKRSKAFYIVLPLALTAWAALAYTHQHLTRSIVMGSIAASLALIYFAFPSLSIRIFQANHWLLSQAGSKLTGAFLILFFYVIFTPYGLLLRLLQKDPLRRAYEPARDSYWIERKPYEAAMDKDCENPF